jgi:hypothetical protein
MKRKGSCLLVHSRFSVLGSPFFILLFLVPSPAPACSFCGPNPQTSPTLRQSAAQAKIILYGSMVNAKPNGIGGGTTEMKIDRKLRNDPLLGDATSVVVPRYIPGDAKDPPKFLLFADIFNGKLDFYQGVPVKSAALVDYLKATLELDGKDRSAMLRFFYRYLDASDESVATDAYLEFAKATDAEVGQVARQLDPAKLKKLIQDPKTPTARVGLFAFLLGACGGEAEADMLRGMIEKPDMRTAPALDGSLAGYIQLKPRDGWDMVVNILKDGKRPFPERCAALGTVRFYHGWKGKDAEKEVLRGLGALLDQGDIADMAIEDLRKWQLWSLSNEVLGQYGKKSHDAPLMRRAIVRYALSCSKDKGTFAEQAGKFVAERRKREADLVKDVEDSLQFEKAK